MVPEYDPLYVAARSVLLDALEALGSQREAVIVVGAQAVYLRTGDADISVAPYTTDADLALSPRDLTDEPHIEELMRVGAFSQDGKQPGAWIKSVRVGGQSVDIPVDLMVPEGLAPPGGSRGARIDPHDRMAARKAVGLEGVVIDNDVMDIAGLEGSETRRLSVRVAGPAALVVAKLHKLRERLQAGKPDRIADKDAADIYRIMQAVPVEVFLERLRPLLADPIAQAPSEDAIRFLAELFGARASRGLQMAVEALRVGVPAERVEAVCSSFMRAVEDGLRGENMKVVAWNVQQNLEALAVRGDVAGADIYLLNEAPPDLVRGALKMEGAERTIALDCPHEVGECTGQDVPILARSSDRARPGAGYRLAGGCVPVSILRSCDVAAPPVRPMCDPHPEEARNNEVGGL